MTFSNLSGITCSHNQMIYFANIGSPDIIYQMTPTGVVSEFAKLPGTGGNYSRFHEVGNITTDRQGNVFVTDLSQEKILKIDPSTRAINKVCGRLDNTTFHGIVVGDNGYIFITNYERAKDVSGSILQISPEGKVTLFAGRKCNISTLHSGNVDGYRTEAAFMGLNGITRDNVGNIYVVDLSTIRMIDKGGVVRTIAGTYSAFGYRDGSGENSCFQAPYGIAAHNIGNQVILYITETTLHRIRKMTINPDGTNMVSTLAGNDRSDLGSYVNGTGDEAGFHSPLNIAVDDLGIVYVTDRGNKAIRKIIQNGDGTVQVSTLAGKQEPPPKQRFVPPHQAQSQRFVPPHLRQQINSIQDAEKWVKTVWEIDQKIQSYIKDICSNSKYGSFTEARILQAYFESGEKSWSTDEQTLQIWGKIIFQQLCNANVIHSSYGSYFFQKLTGEKWAINTANMWSLMKSVRAMLLYLEETPPATFPPTLEFFMVTALNNPLPSQWVSTEIGDIVTIERILSADIATSYDDHKYLSPWGSETEPIKLPEGLNVYNLARIFSNSGKTRFRPNPLLHLVHNNDHKFKVPPGTKFSVLSVTSLPTGCTHILLQEIEQEAYSTPNVIRNARFD